MAVLDHRVHGDGAVAGSGRHHRQLAVETDQALGQAGAGDLRRGSDEVGVAGRRFQAKLTSAIEAAGAALDDGAFGEGAGHHLRPPGHRGGDSEAGEQLLLGPAILRGRHHFGSRTYRHPLGQPGQRLDRHVLHLDRDDVASPGQLRQRRAVVVLGAEHLGCRGCGRVRRRLDDHAAHADRHAGHGQHPPELPPAQDAYGRQRSPVRAGEDRARTAPARSGPPARPSTGRGARAGRPRRWPWPAARH